MPRLRRPIDRSRPGPDIGAAAPPAVLNEVVVDAELAAYAVGERVLAGEHLAATDARDLLLYDRGYPAFWVFVLHQQEQRHFCARLPLSFSSEVGDFLASGRRSAYGLPSDPITLRLVRVTLDNGQTEFLATSLLDETAWPTAWFKDLYHHRWGVEGYKRAKCRVEIENFSGRSAPVVLQDFYAKLFALNLTAICAWVAQAIAERRYQHRRRAYRVNFAFALSKMKHSVVRLLLGAASNTWLTALILAMARSVEALRQDRSFPRKITARQTSRLPSQLQTLPVSLKLRALM